jgi:hypothetical protein
LDDERFTEEYVAEQKLRENFLNHSTATVSLEPDLFRLLGGNAESFRKPQAIKERSREE